MQTMDTTLEEWFTELDRFQERIPLAVLSDGLERVCVDESVMGPFVRFSSDRYRRNLVHAGPAYHALILCWRNGQSSPIHDHRGSSCALRIIRGRATETVFDLTEEGCLYEMRTRELAEGFMCATEDLDIHRISNLEPCGSDLITLHIYSPPLLVMGQYSLSDSLVSEFHDEIHTFAEGEGI